jgi:hypothetical protein
MADEPQMIVMTPRRGRPRLEVSKTSLTTWVETAHYDQIVKMAQKQEKSVSGLVREMLTLRLK